MRGVGAENSTARSAQSAVSLGSDGAQKKRDYARTVAGAARHLGRRVRGVRDRALLLLA